ncbi:hypothetical protein [Bradyrhizobium elkanii]
MSLVALSELIGIMLAAVTIIYLFDSPSITDTQKFLAGRVAELTQLVRSIKTPADADELLAAARRGGLDVRRVALGELVPSNNRGDAVVFHASIPATGGRARN